MERETDVSASKGALVIGSNAGAIQAALTLAQMGVGVKLITSRAALGPDDASGEPSGDSSVDPRFLWPLSLRMATHPLLSLYTSAEVESIDGTKGDFKIRVAQRPRYVHNDVCTACGHCQAECPSTVTSLLASQKVTHSAIHAPLLGAKATPSAYVIDRKEPAPCRVACPLGINVQGFISLLANGKTDRALELINEAAPFAGVLGRVCRQPCERSCNRADVDSPVSIRALHRYVADNALGGISYRHKSPTVPRPEKIAIVGSGPAGLTAAWELRRRGYFPTVFESHGVVGGMLATGIPRFRLPREIREREIGPIANLGVDIRAGITVGRDVDFPYLRERGYRAFFLSIGAQRNNRLNIPGEELEGVVDCMSLLRTLNLRMTTIVGTKIAIIGDGNTAIDSARAVIRKNRSATVKVLSWSIPEELTAAEEEVNEALQEGVLIKYQTIPVQMLRDGNKVSGIRCQRTELTEELMPNGLHRPRPISGTDFVIDADQVIVAIGQSPDASQLNMGNLAIDSSTGAIKANPLTLETSIPGFFAGGDCVTGPNNVVEAMAAGLRAAESIDRYIQGSDLEAKRSLEPPKTAELDVDSIEVAPHKRASTPSIPLRKRMDTLEETTKDLTAKAAEKEAQRCLNCALCSECMECTRVCELDAVFHDDSIKHFQLTAETILDFSTAHPESTTTTSNAHQQQAREGIHVVSPGSNGQLTSQVTTAMALALETAIDIRPKPAKQAQKPDFREPAPDLGHFTPMSEQSPDGKRMSVFLCSCGGSISSVISFRTVARKLSYFPGIIRVEDITQACTEAGAKQIAAVVAESQLDQVVLAACRCCDLEQVCYSCTDRRRMCQQCLNQHLILPQNTTVEFVNIREHCAWAHKDDPRGATRKAVQIISSGVNRARAAPTGTSGQRRILPAAMIIGGGPASVAAARALASRGYRIDLVAEQGLQHNQNEPGKTNFSTPEAPQEENVSIKRWPGSLKLHGSPGNYEAELEYHSKVDHITSGAVLVDMAAVNKRPFPLADTGPSNGLLSRIMSRKSNAGSFANLDGDLLREITIEETPGMFLLPPPDGHESADDQAVRGLAAAARISTYLDQTRLSPRAMAVRIDGKLCRGCGSCADICPYIEMRLRQDETAYAYIDEALCLGCGACITGCPTGAITQPHQSDKQIVSTLRSMLHPGQMPREV